MADQVFISYSHVKPDEDLAEALEKYLRSRQVCVFIDKRIQVGLNWPKEIERQLRASSVFVVLLSEDSIRSDMVGQEIQNAHKLLRKGKIRILPVYVAYRTHLPYDLAAYLGRLQYVVWDPSRPTEELCALLYAAVKGSALPEDPEPEIDELSQGNRVGPWRLNVLLQKLVSKFEATERRFVPLRLHLDATLPMDLPEDDRTALHTVTEPDLPDMIARHNHLLLIGDSGAGKTWLCKRLAVTQARRLSSPSAEGAQSWIPVYIEARQYRDFFPLHSGLVSLAMAEVERVGSFEARIPQPELEKHLAQGRLLLLIDGLNEAGPALSGGSRAIADFCEVFPATKIVVTCQWRGFGETLEFLVRNGFIPLQIGELTNDDVAEYVAGSRAAGSAPEIDDEIWAALPRIPLVLQLLLDTPELPRHLGLVQLLDRAAAFICPPSSPRNALAHLAYQARASGQTFPLHQEGAAEILRKSPELRGDAGVFLDFLCTTGLLESSDGEVRFAHEKFEQYFAAFQLNSQWSRHHRPEELERRVHDEAWQDPIAFAVSLMKLDDAREAMALLFDNPALVARCFRYVSTRGAPELESLKQEFLSDQRTAFMVAATNWPKIGVLFLALLVLAISLSALLGWTSPPIIYFWLAGLGASSSSSLEGLSIVGAITIGAGILLDRLLRSYDRRLLRTFLEPILRSMTQLAPDDAHHELSRLKASLQGRRFMIDGIEELLAKAQIRIARRSELLSIVSRHSLEPVYLVCYALEVLESCMIEADAPAIGEALNDPRIEVHQAAIGALAGFARRENSTKAHVLDLLRRKAAREKEPLRRSSIWAAIEELTREQQPRSGLSRAIDWLRNPRLLHRGRETAQILWTTFLIFLVIGLILAILKWIGLRLAD